MFVLHASPVARLSGNRTGRSVSRFSALVANKHPSRWTDAVHSARSEWLYWGKQAFPLLFLWASYSKTNAKECSHESAFDFTNLWKWFGWCPVRYSSKVVFFLTWRIYNVHMQICADSSVAAQAEIWEIKINQMQHCVQGRLVPFPVDEQMFCSLSSNSWQGSKFNNWANGCPWVNMNASWFHFFSVLAHYMHPCTCRPVSEWGILNKLGWWLQH